MNLADAHRFRDSLSCIRLRSVAAPMCATVMFLRLFTAMSAGGQPASTEVPRALARWLEPQDWRRDTDGPILQLGPAGTFDDTHLFAPCVARLENRYFLWYSGSTVAAAE